MSFWEEKKKKDATSKRIREGTINCYFFIWPNCSKYMVMMNDFQQYRPYIVGSFTRCVQYIESLLCYHDIKGNTNLLMVMISKLGISPSMPLYLFNLYAHNVHCGSWHAMKWKYRMTTFVFLSQDDDICIFLFHKCLFQSLLSGHSVSMRSVTNMKTWIFKIICTFKTHVPCPIAEWL